VPDPVSHSRSAVVISLSSDERIPHQMAGGIEFRDKAIIAKAVWVNWRIPVLRANTCDIGTIVATCRDGGNIVIAINGAEKGVPEKIAVQIQLVCEAIKLVAERPNW